MDRTDSTTESINAAAASIDRYDTGALLRAMCDSSERALCAVKACLPEAERLITEAAARMERGGRLIYVGAGTSGRLGVLDASECPPTFGSKRGQVTGIIAGGERALTDAVEGAEDDACAGRAAVAELCTNESDTVIGISASGGAAYVIAAIKEARMRGALTAAIVCNRDTPLGSSAEHELAAVTGAEVVAGSTRLSAGTAQKLLLNMISTGIFVRLGHTEGGVMTHLSPTNIKLRRRAVHNIAMLTGRAEADSETALDRCGGDVSAAVALLREKENI